METNIDMSNPDPGLPSEPIEQIDIAYLQITTPDIDASLVTEPSDSSSLYIATSNIDISPSLVTTQLNASPLSQVQRLYVFKDLSILDELPTTDRAQISRNITILEDVPTTAIQQTGVRKLLSDCPFLVVLSRDIRDIIYGFLLVNPQLVDWSCLDSHRTMHSGPMKYGLMPAVLRVNKQVYEETHRILYERNVFYIASYN